MDQGTKFLVDECLSPELTDIIRHEFGMLAVHVPWLGKPPQGTKSWQDPDIVDRIAEHDYVFVTNNRRDFVNKYYPSRFNLTWLREAGATDPASPPPPAEIAASIADELETALARFGAVAARLG